MKRAAVGVAVWMTLSGVAVTRRPAPEPEPAARRCEPGARNCAGPAATSPAPHREGPHCAWVETCSLPCGRESGVCCHAEWDCPPPEANLPRC